MKIALAQIDTTVGDIEGNIAKMLSYAQRAKADGARLVVFPELTVCGYPPADLLLKHSFIQANLDGLHTLAAQLGDMAAIVGFVDINPGGGRPLRNALAFIDGGVVKAVQYKTLLPTYDVFDEDRYFEPATSYVVPELDGFRLGLSICEDIWNDEHLFPTRRYLIDPIDKVCESKPDILINISASPFSIGKEHLRHELVRHQAMRHQMPVIYVNQIGGNDQLIFDGRSLVVNADASLIARGRAFEEDLIFVDVTRSADRVEVDGQISDFPEDRTTNIYKALVLGTRDYMSKCGFKKAVVGLSGGIDSAVTCAIAVAAIGAENVLGVAMPSPFSSQGSLDDAEQLAKNLKIGYRVVPIATAMAGFKEMLAETFANLAEDVTEENVQARIRGCILMSISNKLGHLVLTTGNKSELAVGYCTLYGDMCGGLAVISDVPKMVVYDVARHINESAESEVIPASTIEKPPSAELRPGQLDQDSLPPYVVLDGIIHAYVEQRRPFDEIVKLGYKAEVVKDVINRIDRNEYKRKQAAPGLKVTAQAFGVGWRMPIAQRFRERVDSAQKPGVEVIC